MEEYIVYAKTDLANRIPAINSSAFLTDTNGWVEIDRGEGARYMHAQGRYFDNPIDNSDGTHNYVLENGAVRGCAEAELAAELAEIQAELPPPQPSFEESQIEFNVDVDYRLSLVELGLS